MKVFVLLSIGQSPYLVKQERVRQRSERTTLGKYHSTDPSATSISICCHESLAESLSILREIYDDIFEANMVILQVKRLKRECFSGVGNE